MTCIARELVGKTRVELVSVDNKWFLYRTNELSGIGVYSQKSYLAIPASHGPHIHPPHTTIPNLGPLFPTWFGGPIIYRYLSKKHHSDH